ncbi:MAG: FliH/SctL family protein [Planctomycetota bacterium]|jgi:flagellar biosynthesis/type III secretory pathway protein FliH
MQKTLTVHLQKPVLSVKVADNRPLPSAERYPVDCDGNIGGDEQVVIKDAQAQKAFFSQACRTLKAITDKLNQFYNTLFAGHKEEIARLSVEIARKILAQKVQNGDYKIESIVKEALSNAPTRQDVVVHLNPEDMILCQKAQQDEPNNALADIKLVPDPNIGRAECMLETPKGIVESLIEEHLERIGKALKTAD